MMIKLTLKIINLFYSKNKYNINNIIKFSNFNKIFYYVFYFSTLDVVYFYTIIYHKVANKYHPNKDNMEF